MPLAVRNWHKFQHYKDRGPRWIKLYTALLDDPRFIVLPDAAKGQLCTLFMLAAKRGNVIPDKPAALRILLGCTGKLYLDLLIAEQWIERADDIQPVERAPWASRTIPDDVRRAVLDAGGQQCAWCGATARLEIDHIVPVSRGGTSAPDNLQVLCRSCNRSKRSRTNAEHAAKVSGAKTEQNRSKNVAKSERANEEEERETETEKERASSSARGAFFQALPDPQRPKWAALLLNWSQGIGTPGGVRFTAEQIDVGLSEYLANNPTPNFAPRHVVRYIETVMRRPLNGTTTGDGGAAFIASLERGRVA